MDSRKATVGSAGFSRTAGVLIGVGVTILTAWLFSSGLSGTPSEIYRTGPVVELELPYRGLCRGLSLTSQGQAVAIRAADVHSGLARLAVPLEEGRHELVLHFVTVIPGWDRTYPLAVIVDNTPPSLSLETKSVWAKPKSSTLEKALVTSGKTELGAKVFVNDRETSVDEQGAFSHEVGLKPGWNQLVLRVEDKAGNRVQRQTSVFRDTADPEINWRTAPSQAFKTPSARLELLVKDDGPLAGVNGKVDGKPLTWHRKPEDLWLGVTEPLREGRHEVEVRVADAAGRVTTTKREIVIDSSETLGEAVLGLGARGADVSELHRLLVAAGYLATDPGTTFNKLTESALRKLQADEGFEVTGVADHQTIVALGPRIVVNLGAFSLVLERPGQPDRRWSIASGSLEFPTPTGRFYVYEKVQDPTWLPPKSDWAKDAKPVDPGPDNPLGSRWIGLDWGGVGIHGTNAPWTVGSAASHGCMRMETSQVEELFNLVEVGTPVVILSGHEDDPLLDKFWPRG